MTVEEPFKGYNLLAYFINSNPHPTLTKFVQEHRADFPAWHITPLKPDDLELIWTSRFSELYDELKKEAEKIGGTRVRMTLWKQISRDLVEHIKLNRAAIDKRETLRWIRAEKKELQRLKPTQGKTSSTKDTSNSQTKPGSAEPLDTMQQHVTNTTQIEALTESKQPSNVQTENQHDSVGTQPVIQAPQNVFHFTTNRASKSTETEAGTTAATATAIEASLPTLATSSSQLPTDKINSATSRSRQPEVKSALEESCLKTSPSSVHDVFSRWTEDTIDVSSELFQFQKECIQKQQLDLPMTDVELLALNSIFMFTLNASEDCRAYIPHAFDPVAAQVKTELKQHFGFEIMDEESTRLCITIENLLLNNEDAEGTILQYLQSTRNGSPKVHSVAKVIYELYKTYKQDIDLSDDDEENAFVNLAFKPFADVILSEIHHSRLGQKRKHSMEAWEFHANATVSTVISDHNRNCLIVKAKSPQQPTVAELVRMAFGMKTMLDHLVDEHVNQPMTFGIYIEGCQCRSFKMDLQYDGIYRLVQLRQFSLMKNIYDFGMIRNTICSLRQLKTLVNECILSIRARRQLTPEGIQRQVWKRPTVFIPNWQL